MRIISDHLPQHGAGALYSWLFTTGDSRYSKGLRISWGGYRLEFGMLRYPGTATHISVGKLTVSLVGV